MKKYIECESIYQNSWSFRMSENTLKHLKVLSKMPLVIEYIKCKNTLL